MIKEELRMMLEPPGKDGGCYKCIGANSNFAYCTLKLTGGRFCELRINLLLS